MRGKGPKLPLWLIATWLSVCCAGSAWGQIYKWVDRQGEAHFTDNPSRIPADYQPSVAVTRSAPPAPSASPPEPEGLVPRTNLAAPGALAPEPLTKDRLGRGPDYWQHLALQWRTRLKQHVEERERLQLLYDYAQHVASYTRDTSARGRIYTESTHLSQAIADIEEQIDQAETMLHTTLPLEARWLGANPAWLELPEPAAQ
jgi:hypothetical protein